MFILGDQLSVSQWSRCVSRVIQRHLRRTGNHWSRSRGGARECLKDWILFHAFLIRSNLVKKFHSEIAAQPLVVKSPSELVPYPRRPFLFFYPHPGTGTSTHW